MNMAWILAEILSNADVTGLARSWQAGAKSEGSVNFIK
jgi:hypothetical protein